MKNNSLRKKHVRDERRRQRNQRKQAARSRREQKPVARKRENVIPVDFGNRRPVMSSKSNVKRGNPRPYTGAVAA